MVAGAGAWDDLRNVSVRIRLAIQLAAAALFVWTLLPSATTATAWSAPLTIIVAATAALAMVWLTNLYNFMDGIDGIAGITAVAFGIAATVLFVTAGAAPFALLTCALAAATLGFLRYNWPPAQIFMGDVGSGFLGFIAASFVLIALAQNIALGVAVLLPLLPFIVDTTLTLARRARRGQQIAHAHREHLYQRLNQRGYSHKQVSATFGTASALLGAWAIACQRGELSPLATLGPALIATLAAYGVGERASKR
jgi:Fuc2NAc and GlcNAc transferase